MALYVYLIKQTVFLCIRMKNRNKRYTFLKFCVIHLLWPDFRVVKCK